MKTITYYSYNVSFIPLGSIKDYLKEGKIDSCWVQLRSRKHKDIIEETKRFMLKCYGLEITDIKINKGMTVISKYEVYKGVEYTNI